MKQYKMIVAAVAFATCASLFAGGVDFASRQMLAGRAKLAGEGYVEKRPLGVARMAPELTMPVELVYDSEPEKTGLYCQM